MQIYQQAETVYVSDLGEVSHVGADSLNEIGFGAGVQLLACIIR